MPQDVLSLHAFFDKSCVIFSLADWFHLAGLLHDAGKFMALNGEEQVCCAISVII